MSLKRTYEELVTSTCQGESTTNTKSRTFVAEGSLACGDWKEEDVLETSALRSVGKKISKVAASFNISKPRADNNDDVASIEGTAAVEYLMHYSKHDPDNPHSATAEYSGVMKFSGKIINKSGSFYLQDVGKYGNFKAESILTILPNSGTDELAGITGYGHSVSNFTGSSWIKISFSLPESSDGNFLGNSSSNDAPLDRKQIATNFLTLSSEGKVDDAFTNIDEIVFKHHNIHVAGDAQSLKQSMKENSIQLPNKVLTVKKILQDEDHLTTLSHVKISNELSVIVSHTFRFDAANRIVELWDIGQILPESFPNENGPF